MGRGTTVVDKSSVTYNNLDGVLKDEAIALCDVQLHILSHSYCFNPKTHLI
jgi:cyanophycinase